MPTPRSIPKYRPTAPSRLPPAKLPIFRSVVAHPPQPYAVAGATAAGSKVVPSGPHQIIFSTSPRPLIPLTISPTNHRLWNPPAPDSASSRIVERDESGRLARFASKFSSAPSPSSEAAALEMLEQEASEEKQFAPEADLSFLEGETLQSPDKPLGKRDIVGNVKSTKKGKKWWVTTLGGRFGELTDDFVPCRLGGEVLVWRVGR